MSAAGNPISIFKMKDEGGIDHSYRSLLFSRIADFQDMTDHRMSRNSVTLTRPVEAFMKPGMNAYGTTAFERVIVNTYNSAELRMTTDSDFKSERDLFVKLCGIYSFSGWLSFPAFADSTAKLAGSVRTCETEIDFGLVGNGAQKIILAQARP